MPIVTVTGATGFVGKGVVQALLASGYTVHALARRASFPKLPDHPALFRCEGDALNAASVEEALERSEALIHLVGGRKAQMKKTGQTYDDIDVASVRAALRAMDSAGVSRLLLLSAAWIGNSEYVQAKKRAEALIAQPEIEWTVFRPSFILGPGQEWPVVLAPVLGLLSVVPGRIGSVARRAQNVTREELAASMVRALEDRSTIGRAFDVDGIRRLARQPHLLSA